MRKFIASIDDMNTCLDKLDEHDIQCVKADEHDTSQLVLTIIY